MAQIYLRLQTPTIELTVKAKDAAGNKDQLKVGFKRYPLEEADKKNKLLKEIQNDIYIHSMLEIQEEYKALGESKEEVKIPDPKFSKEEAISKLTKFLKEEIVYLKDVNGLVTIDENGKEKEFSVADTRTAKPVEPLWGTPEECLSVLVDSFLESAPYKGSFISAQQKALVNADFQDGEIKN